MNRTEVENYVTQLPIDTQKHFNGLIGGTEKSPHQIFLKNDFLPIFIPQCMSFVNHSVKELHEIAQRKSDELKAESTNKKDPFNALQLGVNQSSVKEIISLIFGIDLLKVSALERKEIDDAMMLAAVYIQL